MGPDVPDLLGGPARRPSVLRKVGRNPRSFTLVLASLTIPMTFEISIFHPAYNLDLEDASSAIDKFSSHVSAVGRGVQHLRDVLAKTRESERGQSSAD